MKAVLLVDSSASFLKVMEILIARLGYRAQLSNCAEDCLKVIKETNPDLVMCETNLSDGEGSDLCRKIKGDPHMSDTFVVMLTTDGSENTRLLAEESGCNDYLTKPVQVRTLFNTLEKLVGKRRRKHIRTSMKITVQVVDRDEYFSLETVDVGEGGVFLKTDAPSPVGTLLQLSFNIPGYSQPLRVEGEVVYAFQSLTEGHNPGMGVSFRNLSREAEYILSHFVEDHIARFLPEKPEEYVRGSRSPDSLSSQSLH